jgi:hypothetical protein
MVSSGFLRRENHKSYKLGRIQIDFHFHRKMLVVPSSQNCGRLRISYITEDIARLVSFSLLYVPHPERCRLLIYHAV